MSEPKQVIVMRKDLKMRRGKEISQGSHAAMAFMTNRIKDGGSFDEMEMSWIKGIFTKVCVQVHSEAELDAIAETAKKNGLQVHVITDVGKTEFGGVPTKTCLAIGPDLPEKIDPVTRHLELY